MADLQSVAGQAFLYIGRSASSNQAPHALLLLGYCFRNAMILLSE